MKPKFVVFLEYIAKNAGREKYLHEILRDLRKQFTRYNFSRQVVVNYLYQLQIRRKPNGRYLLSLDQFKKKYFDAT